MAKQHPKEPQVFALELRKLIEKARVAPDLVVRKATLDIHSSVVDMSPVDTGRFKGNWNIAYGSPDLTVTTNTDPSGSEAKSKALTASASYAGQSVYITNNLPYAIPLEYGHSGQAPQGMVRVTVARWNEHIKKAIGEVSNEQP